MSEREFIIRPARPEDRAAAYAVCLQTGDSGQDATALFPDDPEALGNLFVGPYLSFEPKLAFLLEDAEGVCGYVLGALDSAQFYRRMIEEWLPPLQAAHPEPTGDRANWSEAEKIYYEFHHPNFHFPPTFAPFPSHLHIDLLPRAQGQGQGRRMMDRLIQALREQNSPGAHLALSALNERAYQFYRKLGFHELERVQEPDLEVIYMGRLLD